MGAGASALGERLTLDRALSIGARYGFTEADFNKLKGPDGCVTVKQIIDCVKAHDKLQQFDRNKDGHLDDKELADVARVLKDEEQNASKQKETAAPTNLKTVIAGTVKKDDYTKFYRPVDELGSGMSGTVFSVQSKITGSLYACKSVRKRGMSDEDLNNFRGEVALLSQLDHPNIVKIIEAFESPSQITIIMELCQGGELYDSLITAEFYTEDVAKNLFKQIVHAILYCHNQNVCHRDLKLENFVFDKKAKISTGNEVIKLIDFGLSKRYSSLNRMSTVVGTPYYIAPEVIRAQAYGLECDIWSLGVILFMLLSGIPPVNGDSDQELLANVAQGKLSLKNQWTPDWDTMSDAFDLIEKMLAVDPKKRISAQGIMAHPWIADTSASSRPIDLKIVEGMRKYSQMDPLQRIASKIVAITLSTAEIEQLREAFIDMDSDSSGIISVDEFTKAMQSSMSASADIKKLFEKIDIDGTGNISYSEFISACLSRTNILTKERLLEAFAKLDPDNSGYIEQSELVQLLDGIVSPEEAVALIQSADLVDSDGRVSKEEFMSTVSILWNAHHRPKTGGPGVAAAVSTVAPADADAGAAAASESKSEEATAAGQNEAAATESQSEAAATESQSEAAATESETKPAPENQSEAAS